MVRIFSSYYRKLVTLILTVSLLPLIVVGGSFYNNQIDTATNSLKNELISSSEIAANNINNWIKERKTIVVNISEDDELLSPIKILRSPNSSLEDQFKARFQLEKVANRFTNNYDWINDMYIIDPETGEIIFYTGLNPSNDILANKKIIEAKEETIVISDIFTSNDIIENENGKYETNVPTMFMSSSVKGDAGLEAILVVRINIFKITEGISSYIKDFTNSDAFLTNSDGYVLSKPLRLDLSNLVKNRPELELRLVEQKSVQLEKLLQEADNKITKWNLDGYTNFLGNTVIGSISPIEESDWYYVTFIEKNEAFAGITTTQILLISSILVISTIIVGACHYFAVRLTSPIVNLKMATQRIRENDFDVKILGTGSDEIHELEESFIEMVRALENTRIKQKTAESKFRNLYEEAPVLLRTINIDGIIMDCNQAYAKRLGYPKEEIIGKSIFEHTDSKNISSIKESFETWKKTGFVSDREIWLMTKNKVSFPTILTATNLYDENGNLIGSNTAIKDISEIYEARKKIEADEKQIHNQLEQLRKLEKAKDEFIAMITHELKTPLVPIKGYADILLSEHLGTLNDSQKNRLQIIQSSTQSLLKLVSDLLDVQKIELGQLKLDKKICDLKEIIDEVVARMQPAADNSKITISTKLEQNIACLCDKTRMIQVFNNLISNALDFCPHENGRIDISLSLLDGQAKIIVTDNGVGIVKEKIDKIFVKFYQIDCSNTREHGGTGLGLSVCKGIIENHGGRIWAESEGTGKGTEIHIMLPIEASSLNALLPIANSIKK